MPVRIIIADDHAVFRSGLRAFLEKEEDFEIENAEVCFQECEEEEEEVSDEEIENAEVYFQGIVKEKVKAEGSRYVSVPGKRYVSVPGKRYSK